MDVTQDQFTSNVGQMAEAQQAQVMQLIEQNEPPVLRAFAASLGVTLTMGEEQAPLAPSEEVGGEPPLLPRERNLQEMQQFDNRMDPDPDPDPDVSDPAAFPGQVTAPGAREVQATPVQNQMQQLALGDQVAGMIEQPGAENETGVADDVPMDAPEGAFIINASAIAKVGRLDFEKRILAPAIEELKREGVNIELASLKSPSKQVEGAVDIAVSNKEYYIPPELAEMIGTDLLEKINKRGEAETEKKLKEQQEQQPQQQEQAARPGQRQIPVRGAKGIDGVKNPEVNNLARLLVSEAGGEGKEGMQVIANIVANRLFDTKTNFKGQKTFDQVISARLPSGKGNEFTGYNNKLYNDAPNSPIWKEAVDIAEKQISGKLDDVTEGSTYYRNKNSKAGSTKSGQDFFDKAVKRGRLKIYKTIGNHTVYKDTESSTYTPNSVPLPKRKPASPNNSSPEGRTPLALEEQQSFMSQSNGKEVSPISDKELQGLEKDASTVTYIAK